MVRCTCCSADGHLRKNCPELMIPKPKNFPPLTNAQKRIIDLIISDIFSNSFQTNTLDWSVFAKKNVLT